MNEIYELAVDVDGNNGESRIKILQIDCLLSHNKIYSFLSCHQTVCDFVCVCLGDGRNGMTKKMEGETTTMTTKAQRKWEQRRGMDWKGCAIAVCGLWSITRR